MFRSGSDRQEVADRTVLTVTANGPCKVRFKLFTLDNALIVRKLVRLSKHDVEAMKRALGHVLAGSVQVTAG